ncbi:MAG: ADP-ribosylglycohydrolase family protein [bacterium]
MRSIDHFRGSLVGLAVGDALGTTLEFRQPGSFKPIDDMKGGGPFHLKPGQWTDDTSLALCLAESLVERKCFDPVDQLARFVRWYRDGHLSSTGRCFDIGATTASALRRFEATHEPFCGSTDPHAAGNGSIMRLAPVPLFFACSPAEAIENSGDSSRTTHGAEACVDACRHMGGLLVGAVNGASKDQILSDMYCPVSGYWTNHPLCAEIADIAHGSFKCKEPPAIRGTGHVVKSLEAALWAFHKTKNFREGALLAVNLGDDADTTGAVYGQIAGAFYGYDAIPEQWRTMITSADLILSFADRLAELAAATS